MKYLKYLVIVFCFTLVAGQEQLSLRSNYFTDCFGVKDFPYIKDQNFNGWMQQFKLTCDKNGIFFITGAAGKKYQAGKLEAMKLEELQMSAEQKLEQSKDISSYGYGKLNVICGASTFGKSFAKYFDIGSMQSDSRNIGATFQVASNFSTLESIHPGDIPENGISNYINDPTQGPFASISAAPGTLLRCYGAFYNPTQQPIMWRQTKDRQIELYPHNFLKNHYLGTVTNGYVNLKLNLAELKNYNKIDLNKLKKEISIGFHSNVQVVFGQIIGKDHVVVKNSDQIINQVFTAGVDLGTLSGSENYLYLYNDLKDTVLKIAQLTLDAAYEGTIKSTFVKNGFGAKLYLTLIGGGVFENSWSNIASAIVKNIEFIKQSGLDVTLVIYDRNNNPSEYEQLKKILLVNVQKIGGDYWEFSPDNINLLTSLNGSKIMKSIDGEKAYEYYLNSKNELFANKVSFDLVNLATSLCVNNSLALSRLQ